MFKTIRNLFLIFIIIVLLGFSSMVLIYTLPTDGAYQNLIDDSVEFAKAYPTATPNYPTVLEGDDSTMVDLFTDGIILSRSCYYNQNISLIENAMYVYGVSGYQIDNFSSGDDSGIWAYTRYWHGNLVIMKPLYNLFDYSAIRIIGLFFEFVMVIAIMKQMLKNNLKNYIIPFLLSIFLINPLVIGITLQYSTMYILMLMSVWFLLKFKDKLFEKNNLLYYFLVIGMLTSFFDLLTYPLLSLGIPLIFYFLLKENQTTMKENLIKLLSFVLIWGIGFVGMWISKWIIVYVVLHRNILEDVMHQIMFRVSSVDNSGATLQNSRLSGLILNLSIYCKRAYLMIFSLIGLYYIKKFIKSKNNINFSNKTIIPLVIISLMPFVWYLLVNNHSSIHYFFTYRTLMIFFFGLMCIFELLLLKSKPNDNN